MGEKAFEFLWRDPPPKFHRCEAEAEARERLRSGLEVWVCAGSEVIRVEPVDEGFLVVGWSETWWYKSVSGALKATLRLLNGKEPPRRRRLKMTEVRD